MSEKVQVTEDELVAYVEVKLGTTIDKSKWGDGPWQNEPDAEEFVHLGVRCLIRRHSRVGSFCIYVVVPEGHPWHGAHNRDEGITQIRVHGGITFTGTLDFYGDVYLVGCDMNHGGDFAPGHDFVMRQLAESSLDLTDPEPFDTRKLKYKTIDYVRDEVKELALALVEAAKVQ